MLSTLKTVQTNGDIYTKLSLLVFGLGNMKRGQMAKGLIFLAIEIAALIWFFTIGLQKILELPGLGSNGEQTKEKIDSSTPPIATSALVTSRGQYQNF